MPTARIGPTGAIPFSQIVEATGDITTVSATDVFVTDMSITPVAGVYEVVFSASLENSNAAGIMFVSIYSGGVQQAASEREIDAPGSNESSDVTSIARVTVNGTQAIEARWRRTAGTAMMHERQLRIQAVS